MDDAAVQNRGIAGLDCNTELMLLLTLGIELWRLSSLQVYCSVDAIQVEVPVAVLMQEQL